MNTKESEIRQGWNRGLDRIEKNEILSSVRKGLIYILPLVMVGSFMQMILHLPIPAFQNFLQEFLGGIFVKYGRTILNGTTNIIAVALVLSVSYAYAQRIEEVAEGRLKNFSLILAAVSSFFAYQMADALFMEGGLISSKGILPALILTFLSINIYLKVYRIMPHRTMIYAYDSDSILSYSMMNILPLLVTLAVVTAFRVSVGAVLETGFERLILWLSVVLQKGGGSLFTAVFYVLMVQMMWFFGMHGTNVLDTVSKEVLSEATRNNAEQLMAGEAPTQILTMEFFDTFVFLGGAGCTLGLLFLLALLGRANTMKKVGRISIVPGIFNMNEILIYGLPLIFNPHFLVPFLVTPVLVTLSSFAAFYWGWVPLITEKVSWSTPIFLSGYISTGSISGVLLQGVNLLVSMLCYLPFLWSYENHISRSNRMYFKELCKLVLERQQEPEESTVRIFGSGVRESNGHLQHEDEISLLAQRLVLELSEAFRGERVEGLFLAYQPKSFSDGSVYGAEALLRWQHPELGYVPPPVLVTLCAQAGLGKELGYWVIRTAFRQMEKWNALGYGDLILSINLSPQQLKGDAQLVNTIEKYMQETKISPRRIEFELTEDVAVDQSFSTKQKLNRMVEMGFRFSIDDFGMGSSSLSYIKDFCVNVVKIDISLVRDITDNLYSQEIVRSLIALCSQLDIEVVAEGVEKQEQMEKLDAMGCHRFQGFLFSPGLEEEAFQRYLEQHEGPLKIAGEEKG